MLLIALVIDQFAGEPPAVLHPVVWMGKVIAALESHAPRRSRGLQLLYGGVIVFVPALLFGFPVWILMSKLHAWDSIPYVLVGAVLLKTTFSVRELGSSARGVHLALQLGELEVARRELSSLVSRETGDLDASQVVAAATESVAENTSDSFVAPAFYYLLFGVAGAVVYRVVNTCDAMVGYRGRYEYLGKLAARLDDLLNIIPSRLTGLLIPAAAKLAGGDARQAWRIAWRDHGRTESPNAGWSMSAMAGALGVTLEKTGHYQLGDMRSALVPAKIKESIRIMQLVVVLIVALYLIADFGLRIPDWKF